MKTASFFLKLRAFLTGWRRYRLRPVRPVWWQERHDVRAARARIRAVRQQRDISSFTLEPIEPRLMLSADLTGVVIAHTLPDPSVPINSEAVTVRVLNQGDSATNRASQVAIYASRDQALDASDILLGTANAPKRIDTGRSTDVTISLAIPDTLEPGSYTLLGYVDATNVVAENSEINNLAVGPSFAVVWQFGAVPGRTGNTTLTLTDANGTRVAFSLAGAGLGEVIRDGNQWDLRLTGTGAQTVFEIQTSGGDGRVAIDDIHVLGPLGAVAAPTTDLRGTLATDGPLTAGILLGSADGAVIAAPTILGTTIQNFTVQGIAILGNLSNSTILLGANLGQDGQPGGLAANADNFGAGTLGHFFVGGSMIASIVRVGQDPVDGIFDNGNDLIQGGTTSSIRSITIGGTLSADSRFISGALPATARINSQSIGTASNPIQFKTDVQGPVLAATLGTDTGVSSNDGLTFNPTIVGSLTDSRGIATFVAGFTATPTFDVLADRQSDGSFTFSRTRLEQINGAPLTDGSYVLTLRASDTVGNPRQITVPFTLDTRVTTLVFDLDPASDTPPVGDQQTTAAVVTLTGQTEANAAVELLGLGLSITADATGLFTVPNVALAVGANTFTARAIDYAGNQLTATRTIARTPIATTVSWINPNGGDWNTPTNWSTGALPTADQDVFLDIDVTNPIAHSAGTTQIKSLASSQPLTVAGGTLNITGTLQADNVVSFTGGTVITTGDQIFNAAVVLGANTNLTGNNITFGSTVDSDSTARSLTLNSSGSITFGGAVGNTRALSSLSAAAGNSIAINSNVTTAADITLAVADTLTLNGNLTAGTSDVTLTAPGGAISQGGGSITAAALVLTADQVTSTLTTTVGSLTASTSAGALVISNVGPLALKLVASPDGVSIATTGSLMVNGNVTSGVNAMSLAAGGAISQTAGTLTAGALTLSASIGITLTGVSINALQATNTSGAVSVQDLAGGLNIVGAGVTSGGAVSITTPGTLTLTSSVMATGSTATLTSTGGTVIQAGGTVNATRFVLNTGSGATLTNLFVSNLTATNSTSGVLSLSTTGSVTVVGTGIVNMVGSITLSAPGVITISGDVNSGFNNIALVSTGASIAQTGGFVTGGLLDLDAVSGIALTATAISTLDAVNSTSGSLSVVNTGALNIAQVINTNRSVTISANGTLILTGAVTGATVTLLSAGSIVRTIGTVIATTLNTASVTGTTLTAGLTISNLSASNSGTGNIVIAVPASLTIVGPGLYNAGGTITLSVTGNLTNEAMLNLGATGQAEITGNFTNTASGVVRVDIGATAPQFVRLTISGTAKLNGALDVALVNGFVPAVGDRFQFMTFSLREDFFSTTTLPAGFTVDQSDPNDLELLVV